MTLKRQVTTFLLCIVHIKPVVCSFSEYFNQLFNKTINQSIKWILRDIFYIIFRVNYFWGQNFYIIIFTINIYEKCVATFWNKKNLINEKRRKSLRGSKYK